MILVDVPLPRHTRPANQRDLSENRRPDRPVIIIQGARGGPQSQRSSDPSACQASGLVHPDIGQPTEQSCANPPRETGTYSMPKLLPVLYSLGRRLRIPRGPQPTSINSPVPVVSQSGEYVACGRNSLAWSRSPRLLDVRAAENVGHGIRPVHSSAVIMTAMAA